MASGGSMSLPRQGCQGVSMDATSSDEITSLKQHNTQESVKTTYGKPTIDGGGVQIHTHFALTMSKLC